jgi:hypothetical protein
MKKGKSIKSYKIIKKKNQRYRMAKIQNVPFGGDIFTQGHVVIFDRYYNVQFFQYENYTELFDIDILQHAIIQANDSKETLVLRNKIKS